MKKYIISGLLLTLTPSLMKAQNLTSSDILRYNQNDLNGTARFRAMSGAFGAVGGDISSLKINPAGGAIANYNMASFSLSYVNKDNKATFGNNKSKDDYNGFDLGQLGGLFVFNSNDPNAVMKKFTIGLNYESTANQRNNVYFAGVNQGNSLGDYFLNTANGNNVPFDVAFPEHPNSLEYDYSRAGAMYGVPGQLAFLAANTDLIVLDNETSTTTTYRPNYIQGADYLQSRSMSTSGYTGAFSGNFSAQLGKRIYVGANLNLHTVDYTQTNYFGQTVRGQDPKNGEYIGYYNSTYTYGTGFSFQLGAIAQVTNSLRAGLSYQSPTWYSLKEEMIEGLSTFIPEQNKAYNVYPNMVNIFDRYKIQTPALYTGSLAYVFGKRGLISIDYTIKDYSKNKFRSNNDPLFADLNQEIANQMSSTSEIRVGGEFIMKQWSARAGYRYEESPYKNVKYVGDLNSFSLGLGYNFGGSRLDLSYTNSSRNHMRNYVDMSFENPYSSAKIKTKENWVNLTYTFLF